MRRFGNRQLKTVFVDEISLLALLKLSSFIPSPERIVHFEPLTSVDRRFIRLFQSLRLIRGEVHHNTDHIGMVRSGTNEGQFLKCIADGRKICKQISDTHLRTHPLIRAMSRLWDGRKLRLFFEKSIEGRHVSGEVTRECIRIGLTDWLIKHRFQAEKADCALLIQQKKWFPFIKAQASLQGILLIGYRSVLFRISSVGFRLLNRLRKCGIRFLIGRFALKTDEPENNCHSRKIGLHAEMRPRAAHAIAVRYMGGKIGFDTAERTELFWLKHSNLTSMANILFYNVYREDNPVDPKTLARLELEGIRMYGTGPGITPWRPSKRRLRLFVSLLIRLASGILTCLRERDWVSPYYIHKLASLAWDYSYWFDFYSVNRVVMDVGASNRTIGQTLALDALGGISVAYQYSISNFYPMLGLSDGEDIQFLFSKSFKKPWLLTGHPAGYYVYTGYIYDDAFPAVMGSERVASIRTRLEQNGARFVICFFDENSIQRWDMPVNHPEAVADYRVLLEWLLEDPELGIVFKPKRARDLFMRLATLQALIEASQNTGRCVYFLSDTLVGDVYPAEAALMADISIGKLSGGTAALEAQLVGVPSLLIDDEGLHSHPFKKWGKEAVVVDSWNTARKAIDDFRSDTESKRTIGSWASNLHRLDPFRDGKAGSRMGFFLQVVFEALEQGKSKEIALEAAAEKFQRKWGAGHITVGRHH